MSKHNKCHEDCCHKVECCPRGFIEHVQNYLYLRDVAKIGFIEYWWHETKSLFGGNRADSEDYGDPI